MATNSPPFTAPSSISRRFEVAEWFLEPTRSHNKPHPNVHLWGRPIPPHPRGLFLRSSPITNRLSNKLLQTRNGSEIKLSGPISKRYASKQGMSLQVINTFTDGFPTSWKLPLLDAFQTKHSDRNSSLPQSSRPTFLPSPLPAPLPLPICANSPHPEPNSPPLQPQTRSPKQPSSRPVIQTRKSARITRSKGIHSTQPSHVSNHSAQDDPGPTEKTIQKPATKSSSRKENLKSAIPIPTRPLRSHRSTLPPSQPAPPSAPLPSHSNEQTQTKPALGPRRSTRKPPPSSQLSSSTANKRPTRSRSSIAKPTRPATRSNAKRAPPVTRSRQSNADSGPAAPATRALRKRRRSPNENGTEEKGARKKSLQSSKSRGESKSGKKAGEDTVDGGQGLLAERLKKAQEAKTARRSRRVLFADKSSAGKAKVAGTPTQMGRVESRRAGTPGKAIRDRVEVEGWAAEQLQEYEMGRNSVAADEVGYWDKVAEGVSGKSGDDCRRLWEATWSSPQQEKKKDGKRVGTPEMVSGLLKAGKTARGRGTGKFRTRARMLADRVASGLEDDVLEPLVLGKDQVETPRNVAGVEVGTPGTIVREKRRGMEEAGRLETPEILSRGRNVGFEEADRYVGGFWKRAGRRGNEEGNEEGNDDEVGGESDKAEVDKEAESVGVELPRLSAGIVDGDVYSDEEEPFF